LIESDPHTELVAPEDVWVLYPAGHETLILVTCYPFDFVGAAVPPAPQHKGTAYYFKVSAQRDGAFTVTNTRNGFSRTYKTAVKGD